MAGEPRMRVFAGPNGSGKTTVIREVRRFKVNGRNVDFGLYVNADDIAQVLNSGKGFDLAPYDVSLDRNDVLAFAKGSGLLGKGFTSTDLDSALLLNAGKLRSNAPNVNDRLAQLTAQYLYDQLLDRKHKFTFETVFSHPSKLALMQRARDLGYKVYLHYVGTEDPSINVQRVQEIRVKEGGHNVPKDKIIDRYYRSMDQLRAAIDLAYHTFLWDNSGIESHLFWTHKKLPDGEQDWKIFMDHMPFWFVQYYLAHFPKNAQLKGQMELFQATRGIK